MSTLPPSREASASNPKATTLSDPLILSAMDFARSYMSHYDASHDLSHISRVLALAQHIYSVSPPSSPPLDLRTITLAAILHDVGDKKYLAPGQDAATLVYTTLLALACPEPLAQTVQAVCSGVSYSAEAADPAATGRLVAAHPELGVVQDADRLDAIGAVGLGRMFAYGGAKTQRSLRETMDHLDEKLVKLEGMMKTDEGRRLARERTERLLLFREWWVDEAEGGEQLL